VTSDTLHVCFVCLGNICRSPTAAAVMRRRLVEAGLGGRVTVDSAGTGSWHVGHPPDPRAVEEADRRGVALEGVARQVMADDFGRCDIVIAMDARNLADLKAVAPSPEAAARIHLFREFDPEAGDETDVPDPYFGGDDGFADVFEIVDRCALGLIEHLRAGPLAEV
jgi:protein-tyrosine phosphatase